MGTSHPVQKKESAFPNLTHLAPLHLHAHLPPQGRKWCNCSSQGVQCQGLFHILLLLGAKWAILVFHNSTYQLLNQHLGWPTQKSLQLRF